MAAGLSFALLANFVSPRGLELGHDYFQGAPRPLPAASNLVTGVSAAGGTNTLEFVMARIKAAGLQVADGARLVEWFRDPRYAQEYIIIVDSRDDRHYQAGHIPGAYQLDHYRPASYLPAVLAACRTAEKVVTYCDGGTCEDSELAAAALRNAGVPVEKLYVFPGGFASWATNGLPVEIGGRHSGQLRDNKP